MDLRDRLADGLGYWSIFPKGSDQDFLGWVLLIPLAGIGPDIEIGWRLTRSSWGKGCATEAARPVAEHAFRTLGLPSIVAAIHHSNAASMRVAGKIGLACTGDGIYDGVPCRLYAMTAADHARLAGDA